ncbi:hypothetical protein AB6A40_007370 [Gnathostoma spinigerum]|uniref:Uncharacterized protein n=1 Tax=Gnathostoma spinigerum TaxID=75299 RepID=A0ABD6ELK3_9BILA
MLIDLNALGPASFDISPRLMSIIDLLKSAPDSASFVWRISKILERSPYLGKSEMVRWAEILNRCDEILATAVSYAQSSSSVMLVDVNADLASQVLKIIAFTTLLFESTYSRSIYSSVDHIMQLLDVSNMEVVVKTLNLIHVMSKRSRFISQHLSHDQRKKLVTRIVAIAQPWGGKDHNVRMEEVVNHLIDPTSLFVPVSFPDVNDVIGMISDVGMNHLVAEKMDEITSNWTIGTAEKWVLNVKLRAIHSFRTVEGTMLSVMARLIATSILVYIRNLCDEWLLNVVVYDGFTEEVAHLLHAEASLNDSYMDMIKTEALKTLNSIMALDGPSRKVISVMVEYLEANSYHGFLAQSTRKCVDDLCQGQMQSLGHTSVNFCTALFSLLYHLAGSDSGGDALLSCSLIDTLLNVISCENIKSDFISFVTRSVRVIDVLTTVDASSFTLLTGMNIIISRLVFEIKQQITDDVNRCLNEQCYQERAALIKSMLNFLKRAVQDSQFGDYIRSIMDGELPGALIQIIERSEFFGVSLFNNAICLISTFIYHNPAELTSLQEKGVTTAILRSLFRSELAPSRETITNLPSTFSALCLNENGVREFLAEEPFEHFCNIFVSAKYLPALGRRKNEISVFRLC